LAVGLWPVGSREALANVIACGDSLEVVGTTIAAMVVGENALDADTDIGEGEDGPFEEGCCGDSTLVGQSLGIGIAAVVVDGDMDVVVSLPPGTFASAAGLQETCIEVLSTTIWDTPQLLDVQVDELAGTV